LVKGVRRMTEVGRTLKINVVEEISVGEKVGAELSEEEIGLLRVFTNRLLEKLRQTWGLDITVRYSSKKEFEFRLKK